MCIQKANVVVSMYTYINAMVLVLNMPSEVVILSQYLDINIDYALLSSELYWSRNDLTFWSNGEIGHLITYA